MACSALPVASLRGRSTTWHWSARKRNRRATTPSSRSAIVGGKQRQQDGLQHQQGAAGAADLDLVVPGDESLRFELECGRADVRAVHARESDPRGGFHAGEVLAHQARMGATGADALDAEGLPAQQRQGQRAAQDLPAAFALGAVDGERVHGASSSAAVRRLVGVRVDQTETA